MPLGTEVGLGSDHIVLDGDPASSLQERGKAPTFGPCLLWPNGKMDQDATWYGDRPRPWPHCVTWGPSPTPKGAKPLIFGPCLLWHTTGRIKMPLPREVDLGPGEIVLDGNPAPKGVQACVPFHQNRPCLLWPNGWMDQDATWHEGRPWPRRPRDPDRDQIDRNPAPHPPKGGHNSRPHSSAHVLWLLSWMEQDATW